MPDMFACPQTMTTFVRRWSIPFGVPIIGLESNAVIIHHLERPVRCAPIIGCDRASMLRPIRRQLPERRSDRSAPPVGRSVPWDRSSPAAGPSVRASAPHDRLRSSIDSGL